MSKPFLIIQLRPEEETADNEFESIKFYGGLTDDEVLYQLNNTYTDPDYELMFVDDGSA